MKPDILTLCILATAILATGTRHVAGFLTASQQQSGQPGDVVKVGGGDRNPDRDRERDLLQGNAVASASQRLHLPPIFGVGGGRHGPQPSDVQDIPNVQETQERAVYDPGDELLRAQELGLGVLGVPPPLATDYADAVYNELQLASNKFEVLKKMEEDLRAEQELVDKSALLMKMLEDPSLETLPLVYVEEEEPEAVIASAAGAEDYADLENAVQDLVLGQSKPKRSRYYRRYPWKRHNKNRGNYEPELRYACTPSKEDIFKLLVNLHENRKGNHSKTVNFCNRKRPAKAVFTNIRFLG